MKDIARLDARGISLENDNKWRMRIVFFNAFGAKERRDMDCRDFLMNGGQFKCEQPLMRSIIAEVGHEEMEYRSNTLTRNLNALSDCVDKYGLGTLETDLCIASVIESASTIPEAQKYIEQLRILYADVTEKPLYARDIDPESRGPFGMAKIDLKEGAKPMKKRFFRCSGEREDALSDLIDKMLDRGWIVSSKSEWAAQAFLVPKPPDPIGKKQWRLVVDYRYLNIQTKEYPFPLPLIEDLIWKTDNKPTVEYI